MAQAATLIPGFHAILGPMWAGKTTALLGIYTRHGLANRKRVLLSPQSNTRDLGNQVITHDKLALEAKRISDYDNTISILKELLSETGPVVICIDEGQFIPYLQILFEYIETHFDMTKTYVYVAALNASFQRKMFQPIQDTFGYYTSVLSLTAVCGLCGYISAPFSHRTVSGNEEYMPGGADKYSSACHECWKKTHAN